MRDKLKPKEIKAHIERQGQNNEDFIFERKINELRKLEKETDCNKMLKEFIIIRLTTIIEVYVRTIIRKVCNNDLTILNNIQGNATKITLKWDHILALQNANITIGDIIAHSYSLNKWDDIKNAIKDMYPDYEKDIINISDPYNNYDRTKNTPIISNWATVSRDMKHLFQTRHMLVHELADITFNTVNDAFKIIDTVEEWVKATNQYISEKLYGPTPTTQLEMNSIAAKEMEKEKQEITQLTNQVLDIYHTPQRQNIDFMQNNEIEDFSHFQETWLIAAQQEANLVASQYEGGSMKPLIYVTHLKKLMKERKGQLHSVISQLSLDL